MWWLVGSILVLALLAVAGWLVWRKRKQRRKQQKRTSPQLRLPVVLAHGVLGFDKIAIGGRDHSYFRGVHGHLTRIGAEVHRPRLPTSASIAVRAAEFARLIEMIPAKKVNVIAHSMGGLDVRYAIAKHGLQDRVASLITIGTPHLGTPLADLGTKLSDVLKLKALLGRVIDLDGFYDLTTARMDAFNREIPNAPKLMYASVVARIDRPRATPLLWLTHKYLTERAGDNDGMVPSASQAWGEVLREIEADHWAQIGWSPQLRGKSVERFDALAFYEELLRELRGRGF
jgi:triacylglycerol lipase